VEARGNQTEERTNEEKAKNTKTKSSKPIPKLEDLNGGENSMRLSDKFARVKLKQKLTEKEMNYFIAMLLIGLTIAYVAGILVEKYMDTIMNLI